jgi:hypothetical protein
MHGLTGLIQRGGHRLEPYLLWRLAPRVRTEAGPMGKLSTGTAGFLWTAKLGPQVTFHTEMAGQAGSWGTDSVRSWAGYWRVVFPTGSSPLAPSLRLEYNYATGDSDPADGRHGTFELLYPTPHDKYGLADQVGWKNIHHAGTVAEWKLPGKWLFQTKYHNWWLASGRDGVYTAGGVLIARDPSGRSGRKVGQEVDFQAMGPVGGRLLIGGGVGHIIPGEFLRRTTPGAHYTFPYVMITWRF